MTLAVAGASGAVFNSTLGKSSSNWLNDTFAAIKNSQHSGGMLGALENSGDGSLSSFLSQSSAISGNLALITQNSTTSAGSFYSQIAQQNQQQRANEKLSKVFSDLQDSQNAVKPKNVLDSFIYLGDGTSIDTEHNIMTMSDGTQYDTITGAKYVDPASIVQMANGAYLDTKNNILTLGDGTKIDTVTGLKVSVEA
jgi:hypothetical protein